MGLSDIFGSKETKPKLLMLPEQRAAYQTLLPAATTKGMEFINIGTQPYGGQLTAPLSGYEEAGLKSLGEYLSMPLPTQSNLFGMTTAELEKTLGGKEYDPETGPYYQSYRTSVMRDLQKTIDAIRQRAAGAGGRTVFAGGPVQEERQANIDAFTNLAQVLGSLYQGERMNRLNTVPLALQTMGWAEQVPQSRISAAETLGALPRTVEQAELNARLQDYLNRLSVLQTLFGSATNMASQNLPWYYPSYQPSSFSQIAGAMPGLIQGGAEITPFLSKVASGVGSFLNSPFPQTIKF